MYRFTTMVSRFQPTRLLHSSAKRLGSFQVKDVDDFKQRVLESKLPVIVDFFATWCGPCNMLMPRLLKVTDKQGDKVNLAKVDIDVLEDLASEYNVQSVPTVLAIVNGKIIDQFSGLREEDEIEKFVQKAIGGKVN